MLGTRCWKEIEWTIWCSQNGREKLRGSMWWRTMDTGNKEDQELFFRNLPWSSRAEKIWPWTLACTRPRRFPQIRRVGWAWPPPSHTRSWGEITTRSRVRGMVWWCWNMELEQRAHSAGGRTVDWPTLFCPIQNPNCGLSYSLESGFWLGQVLMWCEFTYIHRNVGLRSGSVLLSSSLAWWREL